MRWPTLFRCIMTCLCNAVNENVRFSSFVEESSVNAAAFHISHFPGPGCRLLTLWITRISLWNCDDEFHPWITPLVMRHDSFRVGFVFRLFHHLCLRAPLLSGASLFSESPYYACLCVVGVLGSSLSEGVRLNWWVWGNLFHARRQSRKKKEREWAAVIDGKEMRGWKLMWESRPIRKVEIHIQYVPNVR